MRKLLSLFATGLLLAAVSLQVASADPSSPTVVTGAASGVTGKYAALGGAVTPNGSPTQYWFEYGTSTGYGAQTGTRRAGDGSSPVTVAANLFGLTPGTEYHFRLDARNAAGTVDGSDGTFMTTAASMPTVVTGSASGVTGKYAALGGAVTPNGSPTQYWFEYGTSTGYGAQTGTRRAGDGSSPVTVAANLFGLTPGTEYHFRLDARNAAGTVDGSDGTFMTTAASMPTVVTGSASGVTGKYAALGGAVTPNGSPTQYWFEYGTSTGYGAQTGTRRAGDGSSPVTVAANLFGLTPGTEYHFRLDARNAAGTVDGSDGTFTTSAVANPHHEWFAGSVISVGSASITVGVSWTGPHDGSLNGQTLTVAVSSSTRINQGPHHRPIALAQIEPNELVALDAVGDSPTTLTATRIHVYCNCHWVGGTISAIASSGTSFSVQVARTGPYDTVLKGQDVTIQVNADTVYLRGKHRDRIAFSDLKLGDGIGVIFGADGFFKSPNFNPATATFTAQRVHVWEPRQVPLASSDADGAAQTSVPN